MRIHRIDAVPGLSVTVDAITPAAEERLFRAYSEIPRIGTNTTSGNISITIFSTS